MKPTKETIEKMIDEFEERKMIAQNCIYVLNGELRKIEQEEKSSKLMA